jgi:hypothetical protein
LDPFKQAIATARIDANYIQQTQGIRQKLVYASWVE